LAGADFALEFLDFAAGFLVDFFVAMSHLLENVCDGLAAIIRLAEPPTNNHTGAIGRREHQALTGHIGREFGRFFSAGNRFGFP
jgi:hypothetical protein